MARPIIKPLKMADGTYVRTNIEELREHFDLPSVLGYYADGRLKEWLDNRYYEEESVQLSELDPNAADFRVRLCELLGVVCPDEADISMDEIAEQKARLTQLKQFTDSDEIIKNADKVAFTQEEMKDMLDKDARLVYLCGEKFFLPSNRKDVVIIGVNSPVVHVGRADEADLSARKITFQDVVLDGSHIKKVVETFAPTIAKDSFYGEQAQFSRNLLCEKNGWIYLATYGGLCRISIDGKNFKKLSHFNSKADCAYVQIYDNQVYAGIVDDYRGNEYNGLRRYSITDGADTMTQYIYAEAGFTVYKDAQIIYECGELHMETFAKRQKVMSTNELVRSGVLTIKKDFCKNSGFYLYDGCIYYYRNNAIYKTELDTGRDTQVCKVSSGIFYIDNGWLYFWDSDLRLRKTSADGKNESKTSLLCSNFFENHTLDKLSLDWTLSKTRIHDGYFYFEGRYKDEQNKGILGRSFSQMAFGESDGILRVRIDEPSLKNSTVVVKDICGYSDYQIFNDHAYKLCPDNGRLILTKYTLDGEELWNCRIGSI